MKTIKLTLYKDKVTPGTVRYSAESETNPKVPLVYIRKSAFPGGQFPDAIELTVEEKT